MMMGKKNQERERELLAQIGQYGFAMDELLLYLDTHPDDRQAMDYFRSVQKSYKDAVKEYKSLYGPLTFDQENEDEWSWVSGPWPWEGGEPYVEI